MTLTLLSIAGFTTALAASFMLSAVSARRFTERIALTPLFLAMQIILIAEIVSFLHVLGPTAFCIGHMAVFCIALLLMTRTHGSRTAQRNAARAHIDADLKSSQRSKGHRLPGEIKPSFHHGRPLLAFTAVAIVIAVAALTLLVALRTPSPMNFDAHTYRLPRVAFWLNDGAVAPVNTNNPRINLMPYDDAFLVAWTYILFDTDRFVHVSSWLFGIGLLALTYRLAREAGLSRRFAPIAPAFLCGMPMFVVQTGGVQSDVFAAYFASAAILGVIRWFHDGTRRWLWIGAAAIGLGIGAKQTVILALPALSLIVVPLLFARAPRVTMRRTASAVVAAALGFAVFGCWSYINNYRWFGHPLGHRETRLHESPTDQSFHGFTWRLKREIFMQFSPIAAPTWAAPALSAARDVIFFRSSTGWWISRIFEYEWNELINRGGALNHDVTPFGIIPSVLYVGALIASWPRRRSQSQLLAAAMLWSGVVLLITIAALITFMTTNGRFLLITAPFGAVGIVAVMRRIRIPRFRSYACAFLLLIGFTGAAYSVAYHVQQPLFGPPGSPLLDYEREVICEPGDTIGVLSGADGPIWSYMTPRDGLRFIALSDADYPIGENGVNHTMEKYGLTTLVTDVEEQHETSIPAKLAAYHTWFAHVRGKGMRRMYVSRRLPASAFVYAEPPLTPHGEIRWDSADSSFVAPLCQWVCNPLQQKALLELPPLGTEFRFSLTAETAGTAIVEILTAGADRHAVSVGANTDEPITEYPRPDGTTRMAIRLASGENELCVGLRPGAWPDTSAPILIDRPGLLRIRMILLAGGGAETRK